MTYSYKTSGTCAREILLDVDENGVLNNVSFTGGCNGNLNGISKLVSGLKIDEVIEKLEGVKCGPRPTSCPDQLAQALKEIKEKI